jgi:hypothetical protein
MLVVLILEPEPDPIPRSNSEAPVGVAPEYKQARKKLKLTEECYNIERLLDHKDYKSKGCEWTRRKSRKGYDPSESTI